MVTRMSSTIAALDTTRHTPELAPQPDEPPPGSLSRPVGAQRRRRRRPRSLRHHCRGLRHGALPDRCGLRLERRPPGRRRRRLAALRHRPPRERIHFLRARRLRVRHPLPRLAVRRAYRPARDGGGRQVPAPPPAPRRAHQRRAPDLRLRARRSEEHTSELQSLAYLVCRLLLEKKKK